SLPRPALRWRPSLSRSPPGTRPAIPWRLEASEATSGPGWSARDSRCGDTDWCHDARMEGERDVVESVRLDDAWTLVEEFAGLVRDSGSGEELLAVERITTRLDAWRVPYRVHRPELLISLPRRAGLTVDGRSYRAKTPSMARSTRAGGETAPLAYQPSEFARSVH